MLQESVVYAPRDGYPLYITAKRYWVPEPGDLVQDDNALTLIVLHSTSFHKETWEPSLETLFSLHIQHQRSSPLRIKEAWALDCPNHGESARLNRDMTAAIGQDGSGGCEKYAQAVHHFLSAGPNHGARVNFRARKLVGVGHSLGANAMLLLQHIEPTFAFSSIIISEPMVSADGPERLADLRKRLVEGARKRRENWPNRQQAKEYLATRIKKWDPRVFELFVNYAIVPKTNPQLDQSVCLACSREQEVGMYIDAEGATKPVRNLDRICNKIPIHLIVGGVHDLIPDGVHAALVDPRSGRRFATITVIEESGHLMPQEVPDQLGSAIHRILCFQNTPKVVCKL
ncbi:Alpha/beta hydrolase fold-1 [Infundibulicybe gibba]|nr:Alpha/beta hydrolase fold-1 [Infundibulicybe gibba]